MQTDYQNLVDLLDEWNINHVTNEEVVGYETYLFVDMFDNEMNTVCGFEFSSEDGSSLDVYAGNTEMGYDILEVAKRVGESLRN